MGRASVCLTMLAILTAPGSAQGWSRFHGADGAGAASVDGLPSKLQDDTNLAWRTEVVKGQSSPVLGNGSVFLTGADDERLVVTCLEQATGALRWERRLERAYRQDVYVANGSASPSPTTDGTNVYAFFPELGLISFDVEGTERWRLPLGPFKSFYGLSSSPILVFDTLVLQCDQQQGSFLLGVDAATGKQRWRTERAGIPESWSTPVAYYPLGKPRVVLVFGSYFVSAYSVADGAELWRQGGVGYGPVASPALVLGAPDAEDMLYVCVHNHAEDPLPTFEALCAESDKDLDGRVTRAEALGTGWEDHFGWVDTNADDAFTAEEWNAMRAAYYSKDYGLVAFAIKADGTGLREVWRHKRSLPSIASPVLEGGRIHLLKSGGMLTTLDAATGEPRGFQRLKDAEGDFDASPIAADSKLFVAGSGGELVVLSAADEPKVLGARNLGEPVHGTPAFGRMPSGRSALYVRSDSALYCFAEAAKR